ncbi:hypothetical protein P8C59_002933 [Phyllachora maydis]|uniref:Ureidoglycolate hydrolase n=1 Tax=Phyllachora maydis TaxID=1825666 RepID=A0AAD9HZE7_9PEZI|nr:hypothetical protein P8C59_002933 [Phyllachora maydis]
MTVVRDLHTLNAHPTVVVAKFLWQEAFAAFGDVIENPRPALHPSAVAPGNVLAANQGTALKFAHVSRMANLYAQAPSSRPADAVMNMFVCAARQPRRPPAGLSHDGAEYALSILERHPFTTQTFVPMTPDPALRYLVVVAPSRPASLADRDLPVPTSSSHAKHQGLPDLSRLRAFVAAAGQAVTYGPGTWHAPMMALGPPGSTTDFLVVQFSNGVAIEDCQEVTLSEGHLSVRVSDGAPRPKM